MKIKILVQKDGKEIKPVQLATLLESEYFREYITRIFLYFLLHDNAVGGKGFNGQYEGYEIAIVKNSSDDDKLVQNLMDSNKELTSLNKELRKQLTELQTAKGGGKK